MNFTANCVGDEGAEQLAKALKVNPRISSIHLYDADFGDEGAEHIADAIKESKSITALDLGDGQIGEEGVIRIIDALKVNKSLIKLSLKGNPIDEEGAKHIADALKVNKSLTIVVSLRPSDFCSFFGTQPRSHQMYLEWNLLKQSRFPLEQRNSPHTLQWIEVLGTRLGSSNSPLHLRIG